ncbi:LysR substrate-binding domain-containing protein, partial [Epibacterium sp. MM17-32]|uniref:LysR substrate-binding domain-containing protein n=1 Tax=Epibacterium sp. MM17-32 TaxID=2917734 RepID=UPI001EF494C1
MKFTLAPPRTERIEPMRRLPPLHALRAFEAAARHLHFARAAAELHLTPTAISHQIRQLEEILEVKLFHRYPRPIRLSAEGATLYPVLRESFDRMSSAVAGISQQETGRPLTVSVTVAFASLWLMRRLPALRSQTGLNLKVEADNQPVDLSGSDVDFAVRYAVQAQPEDHWLPLFKDKLIPLCAPELLRRTPINDDAILRLPLIEYRWNCGAEASPSWQRWSRAAGLGAMVPEVTQHFSEEINAIDSALAGQGVVLASSVLAGAAVAAGHLVRLSDVGLPGRTFWAVSRSDHPHFAEVERFAS